MERTANFERWIAELRSTDALQCRSVLHAVNPRREEPDSFCCLGLGSRLAGIQHRIPFWVRNDETRSEYRVSYGSDRSSLMAPVEFIEWLGLVPEGSAITPMNGRSGVDVAIDMEFTAQGSRENLERTGFPTGDLHSCPGASLFNDSGFTFAQIADILDYFGPAPIEHQDWVVEER